MTMLRMLTTGWRRGASAAALALCLLAVGCVERTVTITSEPTGALLFLNDEEVGRTPVTVPFTFYGTYDVRLEHEGFAPLWTKQKAKAPWWENPGPDLIAETKAHNRVHLDWHFVMEPVHTGPLTLQEEDALLDRAGQLRATLGPATQPATRPASRPARSK